MKRLILWLAILLPFLANAQVNGTIQKTSATGTIRGSFGSLGLDTLPRVTGALVDGYILKYHAATNKWYASPDPTYPGLQDSLTKKANKDFSNVASGAIAKSKVDTTATGLQTVSNFFPKGDTRYQRSSVAPTSISATSPIFYNSGTGVISSQAASGSLSGYVTTGIQTFAGDKTFDNISVGGLSAASVSSTASDGLSGIFTNNSSGFESLRATNNGSGLIASFRNSGGIVASILNSGGATFNGSVGIGSAATGYKLEVYDALPALFVTTSDATTSSYAGVAFKRNTKLNGNGNGFLFSALNSSDTNAEYGYFGSIIESNTASSENGAFVWSPIVAGVRTEKMRLSSSGNLTVISLAGTGTRMVVADNNGILSTQAIPGGGGGSVTGVAIASANGLAGTSDGNSVVPTITLSTSVTGLLKGNGTAISAATSGTDYLAPTGSGAGLSNVVNSITGTSNQVIASASTGAVTLSLPQSIATTSSPTFGAMTITGNITAANLGTASTYTAQANNGALTIPLRDTNGDFAAGTITATLTGNASTATSLQTARNIQGVSFNGTADINPINGTGFVKATGTTLSYDNTTYAPLNSPTFTGTPTLPTGTIAVTQSPGNNSTAIATTAYVDGAISTKVVAGTFTFSGTGSQTVFTQDSANSTGMVITPTSADASGAYYLTSDNNGCGGLCDRIIITFLTAPASGTNNITFNYIKKN